LTPKRVGWYNKTIKTFPVKISIEDLAKLFVMLIIENLTKKDGNRNDESSQTYNANFSLNTP